MARVPGVVVRAVVIVGIAVFALTYGSRLRAEHDRRQAESTENFRIGYEKPPGWKELWHGPQALFVYQHPQTGVKFRASVNQVVSEFNPTPNMTSDSIAHQMVENTKANMPGWDGVVLDVVNTPAVDWRLVRREGQGRCVVSAFGVRGNTTAMVSLVAAGDSEMKHVDATMPRFREFLQSLTFTKTDMRSQ